MGLRVAMPYSKSKNSQYEFNQKCTSIIMFSIAN